MEPVRRLPNRAGSRNSIVSSRPSKTETSTGPRRASASITPSTSTSGAEAPAVRPTVRTFCTHSDRNSLAVGDQIARYTGFQTDLAQAIELELFLRADHQDESTSLLSSRTAVWRFWVA